MAERERNADSVAAEVLHELRQPLLALKAYLQMTRDDPARSIPIETLLKQVERIEQIVADFQRLSSDRPPPLEPLLISNPVKAALGLFTSLPGNAKVHVELVLASATPELHGNPRLLEQLTLNLLNNAREAMGGAGKIKVVVGKENEKPAIWVADWGPGVPADLRERIFHPYVTTKATGHGLGLAISKRIANEHGADLELVSSDAVEGKPATVFRVLFGKAAPVHVPAPSHKERVLVVDDEQVIRTLFKDLLGKELDVVTVASAEEGAQVLEQGFFHLILVDKNLPGLSGLELAERAKKRWPKVKVMLMTGYPSLVTAQQASELGLVDYLIKPFDDIKVVRDKIRQVLASPPPLAVARNNKRIDVYEDNPLSSRQVVEALNLLGLQPNVITDLSVPPERPAAVVLSWDFTPALGVEGLLFVKAKLPGVQFIVLAEHLTMEAALESLRGGATACLPKLLSDAKALSRELHRALKLPDLPPPPP